MKYKTYEYDQFFGTGTKQKVLEFFRNHPDKRFSAVEINSTLGIPQASLNRALNDFERLGLLHSEERGKFKLFLLNRKVYDWLNVIFNHMQKVRLFTLEQRKREAK